MKLSILVAGALVIACGSPEERAPARPLPTAAVRLVEPRPESHGARVPAVVERDRRATVATRIPARVLQIHVREGDAVEEGSILVSLADDDLRAQLAGARAVLRRAAAHEKRLRLLSGQGAATAIELEAAEAELAQARAAVGAAEEALRYTRLRAPFSGKIQARRATAGDLVTAGAPLLELEGGELEVVATLSGEEMDRISLDQRLSFVAGREGGEVEVVSIAPSADPVAHRVEVRARVLEPWAGLRAGTFARIELPPAPGAAPELWIPTSSVIQRGDLRGAFVAREGRAELRWLLLGDEVGKRIAVRAGLAAGEQLIDQPGELRDGQPIQVMNGP